MSLTKMKMDFSLSNYTWVIPTFSQYDSLLESEKNVLKHNNNNIVWNLELKFPTTNERKYVSLFLNVTTKNKATIQCKFIALDNDRNNLRSSLRFTHNFSQKSRSRGYSQFLRQDNILPLKDDILIIKCSIIINPISDSGHVMYNCNDQPKDVEGSFLMNGFNNLLPRESFSDVVLQTSDGKQFFAHKFVLGSYSPVFQAMFEHNMIENQENKVIIEDIKSDVLEALLEYVYLHKFNGEMPNLDQLLIASDKYQIDDLKRLCEIEYDTQLTDENAVEYLILAENSNASKLKKEILNFIKDNLKDIGKKNVLKSLKNNPDLIYDVLDHISK